MKHGKHFPLIIKETIEVIIIDGEVTDVIIPKNLKHVQVEIKNYDAHTNDPNSIHDCVEDEEGLYYKPFLFNYNGKL